ncbi:hypothetical protein BKI52_18490 [marine bacterium AO1-C]|nr:hypothetical protein BKI52_18490 [marine bacterium AO1-C]
MKKSILISLFSLQFLTLGGVVVTAYYAFLNKTNIQTTQAKLRSTFTFMDKMAEVQKQQEDARKPIAVGSQAPEFSLKNEEGKEVKLEDLKGQKTLLVFSQTNCQYCEKFYPILNEFQEKQADVKVVLMHYGATPEQNKSYKAKQGIKATMLAAAAKQMNDYKVLDTPTTVLIDGKGKVLGSKNVTNLKELMAFVKQGA